MKTTLLLLVVASLAGCASDFIVERAVKSVPEDRPASYRVAFGDGCSSAVKERSVAFKGEFRRDDVKMKNDGDYALGWNDGYRNCDHSGSGGTFIMMPKK